MLFLHTEERWEAGGGERGKTNNPKVDGENINELARRIGEKIEGEIQHRRIAGVSANLEALAYRFAAADLCAAGVGAPHPRQRLYWVGYSIKPGLEGLPGDGDQGDEPGRVRAESNGPTTKAGAWNDFATIQCRDGKTRRIESGVFPLAYGVPARVVRLRGYGNAIVPQVAAEFVKALDTNRNPD